MSRLAHILRGLGSALMAGATGAATATSMAGGDFLLAMANLLVCTFLTLGVLLDIDMVKEMDE